MESEKKDPKSNASNETDTDKKNADALKDTGDENVRLDEVAQTDTKGFEHIDLEDDESEQHPEQRKGAGEGHETLLDEVAKKDRIEYPDIE